MKKEKAYKLGVEGFLKGLNSAPYMNKEFMDTLENCSFSETEKLKKRWVLMKLYIEGYTFANLQEIT